MDEIVKALIRKFNIKAAIFDLDGTLIDNNAVHLKSWLQYLKTMGRVVTEEEYRTHFNGRTNKDVLEYIFKKEMTKEEALPYTLEKEAVYREMYKHDILPVEGLLDLLHAFEKFGVPMAIATSGIQPNIDFMFDHIDIQQYFPIVINSSHISRGKPDPEIYIKASQALGVDPANCLVFEDAIVGIRSAKAAGMKVVAITTTEAANALSTADMIIQNFLPASFQF